MGSVISSRSVHVARICFGPFPGSGTFCGTRRVAGIVDSQKIPRHKTAEPDQHSQRPSYGLNSTWRSTLKIQFQFGRVLFALAGRRLTGNVRQNEFTMHTTVIIVAGILSALGVWSIVLPNCVFRVADRVSVKIMPSRSPEARELLIRLFAGAWIGLIVGSAITIVRL